MFYFRRHNYKLIFELNNTNIWNMSIYIVRKLGRARLFDLIQDPYEQQDLSRQKLNIVQQLIEILYNEKKTGRKSVHRQMSIKQGDPAQTNGTYTSYWC